MSDNKESPQIPEIADAEDITKREHSLLLTSPAHSVVNRMVKQFGEKRSEKIVVVDSITNCSAMIDAKMPCVIVISMVKESDFVEAVVVLRKKQSLEHKDLVRILIVARTENKKIKQVLLSQGAEEIFQDSISHTNLLFKVSVQFGAIQSTLKKGMNDRVVLKGGPAFQTGTHTIKEDIWLIKGTAPKKIGVQWLVEVEGPDPDSGDWEFQGLKENGEEQWSWKFKNENGERVKGSGDWVFTGQKPTPVQGSNRWKMVAAKPDLTYKEGGKPVGSKIQTDPEKGIIFAADTEDARQKVIESKQIGELAREKTREKQRVEKEKKDAERAEKAEIARKQREKEKDKTTRTVDLKDPVAREKGDALEEDENLSPEEKAKRSLKDTSTNTPLGEKFSEVEEGIKLGKKLEGEKGLIPELKGKNTTLERNEVKKTRASKIEAIEGVNSEDESEEEESSDPSNPEAQKKKFEGRRIQAKTPEELAKAKGDEILSDETEIAEDGTPVAAEAKELPESEKAGGAGQNKKSALAERVEEQRKIDAVKKTESQQKREAATLERKEQEAEKEKEATLKKARRIEARKVEQAERKQRALQKAAEKAKENGEKIDAAELEKRAEEIAKSEGGFADEDDEAKDIDTSDFSKKVKPRLKMGADAGAEDFEEKGYMFRKKKARLQGALKDRADNVERGASDNPLGVWESVEGNGWIFVTSRMRTLDNKSIQLETMFMYLGDEASEAPIYDGKLKMWITRELASSKVAKSFGLLPLPHRNYLLKEVARNLSAADSEKLNDERLEKAEEVNQKTLTKFMKPKTAAEREKARRERAARLKLEKEKAEAQGGEIKKKSHLGFFLNLSNLYSAKKTRKEIYLFMAKYVQQHFNAENVIMLSALPNATQGTVLADTNSEEAFGQLMELKGTHLEMRADMGSSSQTLIEGEAGIFVLPCKQRFANPKDPVAFMMVQFDAEQEEMFAFEASFLTKYAKQLSQLVVGLSYKKKSA